MVQTSREANVSVQQRKVNIVHATDYRPHNLMLLPCKHTDNLPNNLIVEPIKT